MADASGRPLGAIARAFAAMRGTLYRPPANTIAGLNTSGFPTALQPVQPVGQPGSQPLGFSYYYGINQQITPRFDDVLSAQALRELATYPLARICIENVKDVLCAMQWKIQLRRIAGQPISEWKNANASDKNIGALTTSMEMPDGETPWPDWWRPVIEDMLVIDAASILTESYLTGQVAGYRWTDGADILRLIDDRGYTPVFPSPAYTQLWEGIPRLLLNTGQLIYRPSNIVAGPNYSSKLYGTSITQQMAAEIRIGQERLRYVLAFYTEGGVPGLAQVVPPGIAPDKIQEAQAWMNSEMSGQLAKRRGWRLVQGFVEPDSGSKDQILELKDPILADVFDDLHIRKMAFAYGVSAQRLLKQMNRASAEAGQDAAEKEGIIPRLVWMKGTADTMLRRRGAGQYEVVFDTDDELDAGKQAEVSKTLISIGRVTIDEDREARGLVPFGLPETKAPIIITASGVQPLEGAFDRTQQQLDNDTTTAEKPAPTPVAAPKPAAQAGKRGGARKKSQGSATVADPVLIDTDKLAPTTTRYIGFMTQRLSHFFRQAAKRIGKAWIAERGSDVTLKTANDDEEDKPTDNPDLERELLLFGAKLTPIQRNSVRALVLLGLANMKWETLPQRLQGYYSRSGSAGQGIGLDQIQDTVPETADIPTRAEMEEASAGQIQEFVAMRTAELVGMRRLDDGTLIENPDARWAISDLTRQDLVKTVCQAIEEGWTANQLAAVVEAAYSFSSVRSAVIARSELARSQAFGNYITWHLTGLAVFVRWRTSGEENVCRICMGFEAQGVVPLGHEFAPGIEYPTAHPFCFSGDVEFASADHVSAVYKRRFEGEFLRIETFDGQSLTCTPNHPVLTRRGWIAAHALNEIDELVKGDIQAILAARIDPDDKLVPTIAEEVSGAFLKSGRVASISMPSSAEDFHGDGVADGEVHVVLRNRPLRNEGNTTAHEHFAKLDLNGAHLCAELHGHRTSHEDGEVNLRSAARIVSRFSNCTTVFNSTFGVSEQRGLSHAPHVETTTLPGSTESAIGNADVPSDILARFSGNISFVKVAKVEVASTRRCSHVYNLQTESGYFFANGFIVHNCNCGLEVVSTNDDN